LSEEPRGVVFAIEVQTGNQDKFLRLFLLIEKIAVAIPGRRQSLCPVVVEELFQDFLPAEFTHDVFVEL